MFSMLCLTLAMASTPADEATAALALAQAARQRNAEPQDPPVKAPAKDYAACRAVVESGGKAVLAIGIAAPPGAYSVATLPGFKDGLWECFSENGVCLMRPLAVPQKMDGPVKQAVKQFRKVCVNGTCRLVEITNP